MGSADIEKLVQPGDVLAGKYRIERILGQGGMGVVVAAHHLQLDERVAIKFLLPDAVGRQDLVSRFEREARAAVKIKSEHVARVIDVGVLDTGSPYMVMEYLEGVDLAARLEQTGPISVLETADFVLQASEAIVEAHALGIIHRDLKPANLFCIRGADGLSSIKVLDFGISKSGSLGGSGGLTQTSSMLGSPFYMSPEQMQSAKSVDMRTDIWALGVILYQCVTGIMPFQAETLPELVLKIVTQPLPPLRSVRPDVPRAFEQVVHRCLEKDRDQRYQHIGELAQALVEFAPERGRASADRITRVIVTSGMATSHAQVAPSSRNMPIPQTTQHISQNAIPSQRPALHDSQVRSSQPNYLAHPSMTPQPQYSGPPSHYATPMGPPPGSPPPGSSGPPGHAAPGFGVTTGGFGNTNPPGASSHGKWLVIGTVVAFSCAMLVVGTFALKTYMGRQQAAKLASSGTASVSVAAPPPPPPVSATATPEILDAGSVVAAATHDAGPVMPPTQTPPSMLPGSRKLPPPGQPDCSTNYYHDAKGNKVYKPECL